MAGSVFPDWSCYREKSSDIYDCDNNHENDESPDEETNHTCSFPALSS